MRIRVQAVVDMLPDELLDIIFAQLVPHRDQVVRPGFHNSGEYFVPAIDKGALSAISRVSRRWRHIILPLLFQDIHLAHPHNGDANFEAFAAFLDARPWACRCINYLAISRRRTFASTSQQSLSDVLKRLSDLHELALVGVKVVPTQGSTRLSVPTLYLATRSRISASYILTTLGCFRRIERLHLMNRDVNWEILTNSVPSTPLLVIGSLSLEYYTSQAMTSDFVDRLMEASSSADLKSLTFERPGGMGLRRLLHCIADNVTDLHCDEHEMRTYVGSLDSLVYLPSSN